MCDELQVNPGRDADRLRSRGILAGGSHGTGAGSRLRHDDRGVHGGGQECRTTFDRHPDTYAGTV
jgi:hypothetical protein